MSTYFDELASHLSAAGMPDDRTKATIEELTAYLAESGSDPVDEFGPPADLARELAGTSPTPAEPAADAGTWCWTADLFHDVKMLNEYGAQGWEVQKVDGRGLFVSTRDPERAQQWEYRREPRGRGTRLAPDGWEPCGTWVIWEYFKRPKAATLGPAAELTAPSARPERGIFFSPGFYALLAAIVAISAVTALSLIRSSGTASNGLETMLGILTGLAAGTAIPVIALWWRSKRR